MLFMFNTPIGKIMVRVNKENLFGWWSFAQSISQIGTKNNEVLSSRGGIKEDVTCLVDAVSIGVIKNANLTMVCGTITRKLCFFLTVQEILDICTHQIKMESKLSNSNGLQNTN